MKTLDEVIDIMEHPLYGADEGFAEIAEDDIADALEYLKRYKADLEKKCSNCKNWHGHKNYDPNDPWREEYYCKWGLWSYPDDSCARWEEML